MRIFVDVSGLWHRLRIVVIVNLLQGVDFFGNSKLSFQKIVKILKIRPLLDFRLLVNFVSDATDVADDRDSQLK